MIRINAFKPRDRIIHALFILGAVLYLCKGQSALYALPDCSGDPIAATVELVQSDPPDYGFFCLPPVALTPDDGRAFAAPAAGYCSDFACLSALHDDYARAVLKSNEQSAICRSRRCFIRTTIAIPHSSPDADPPQIG